MASRFFHGYYIFNILLIVSYAVLRWHRLDPKELAMRDILGVTREGQIYFSVVALCFVRILSAPTLDAYFSTVFMFARVGITICLGYMAPKYCALYLSLWIVLYFFVPQPRFKYPQSISSLNHSTLESRVLKNKHKTYNVVWAHATWSSRCTQLAPVFSDVAIRLEHPRIQFSKIDIGRWGTAARKLDISTRPTAQQLPSVILYRRGVEVARLPVAKEDGSVDRKWKSGFSAKDVIRELGLDKVKEEAEKWEAVARRKLREAQEDQKLNLTEYNAATASAAAAQKKDA